MNRTLPTAAYEQDCQTWAASIRSQWHHGEQTIPVLPGNPRSGFARDHQLRYDLAATIRQQHQYDRVLDAACGAGYGGLIMDPPYYRGLDIQPLVLEAATRFFLPYFSGDAHYQYADLTDPLPAADGSYDLVTSLETIEHVDAKAGKHLAHEVFRVLRPGGCWLVSSPLTGAKPALVSKYHVHEYRFSELYGLLLRAGFQVPSVYEQSLTDPTLAECQAVEYRREQSEWNNIFYVTFQAMKPEGSPA